ncbi:hypothetical protein KY363_01580 [Candidatus Woesearchaeota archaeon]|nr:hypothetical protein [Candidatus Woesearchaeota archaeon]
MSLKLMLKGQVPGADIADAVRKCMRGMEGFDFRELKGSYAGEARLVPGYLYLDGIADDYEPLSEDERHLVDIGLVEMPQNLPYHGRLAIYRKHRDGNVILEVSRENCAYREALEDMNDRESVLFVPLFTGVRALSLLVNRALRSRGDGYPEIQYRDNIFTVIDERRDYDELVFHVNALDPEFGGGVVRDMDDIHFRDLSDVFVDLCYDVSGELGVDKGSSG